MGKKDGSGWGHAGTDSRSLGKAGKPIYSGKGGGSSKPPKKGCALTLLAGLGSLGALGWGLIEAAKSVL